MYWIKKALVTIEEGELIIKIREVAENSPVNRILDVVGFYAVDGMIINDNKYLVAYEKEEFFKKKTKCLFTKITKEGIVNIQEEDFQEILELAKDIMEVNVPLIS
jgi:hypothetical protein